MAGDEEKEPVPVQLESAFPKDAEGKYSILHLSQLRNAFAIIDDATATREGLQKAYDEESSRATIVKAAAKADDGDGLTVEEYINEKAMKAEEMSQAKADVIHSYIMNLLNAMADGDLPADPLDYSAAPAK